MRLGHEVVGTEHILLGLLDDADYIVRRHPSNYGLHPEVLKAGIESLIGPAGREVSLLTFRQARERSLRRSFHGGEARKMSVNYIGTEHIPSGHPCGRRGMAAQLLASHGMHLPRTRMTIRNILSGNQSDPDLDPLKTDDAPQRAEGRTQSRTPTLDQIGTDLTGMARNRNLTRS